MAQRPPLGTVPLEGKQGDSSLGSGFSDPIRCSSLGPRVYRTLEAFLVPGVQGAGWGPGNRSEENSLGPAQGTVCLSEGRPQGPPLPLGSCCCRLAQGARLGTGWSSRPEARQGRGVGGMRRESFMSWCVSKAGLVFSW